MRASTFALPTRGFILSGERGVLQNVSKFSLKLQFCSRSYSDVQNVEEEDPLLALQLYKLVSFLQSKANEREVEVSE